MPATSGPRRRAKRILIEIPGTLAGRTPKPVTVVDLSLTGCLARCPAALDSGSIHDLRLLLGKAPFDAKAQVTGASVDGMADAAGPHFLVGFHFLRLNARDEAALRGFLDEEIRRASCGPSR